MTPRCDCLDLEAIFTPERQPKPASRTIMLARVCWVAWKRSRRLRSGVRAGEHAQAWRDLTLPGLTSYGLALHGLA